LSFITFADCFSVFMMNEIFIDRIASCLAVTGYSRTLTRFGTLLRLWLLLLFVVACTPSKQGKAFSRVVATTSWTAAYARTAGADDVHVLAPLEMAHPTEYELRPSDVAILQQADIIIYAGYETMMQQLQSGLDIPQSKLISVRTEYAYNQIESNVMKIAGVLNSDSIAKVNTLNIKALLEEGRTSLAGLPDEAVIAQFHTAALVRELGITPKAVFGPSAPEAAEIAASAKEKVTLIIDNYHNPIGKVFRELHPEARYVQFINFPGYGNTRTLEDVIRYNLKQLKF